MSRLSAAVEGVSRSPIYSWFGASLTGLPSIRSYSGCVKSFSQTSRILINKHNCSYIAYHLSGRWLSLRLDSFSAVMVFIVGTMMVFLREDLSVALTGVALTYLIQLIGILQWVRRDCNPLHLGTVLGSDSSFVDDDFLGC